MSDNVVDMSGKPTNVIEFPKETLNDVPAQQVIESAVAAELDEVIVIGWDKNGESYFASSQGSLAEIILDLEICKKALMDGLNSGE